jgi:hypothetical protein
MEAESGLGALGTSDALWAALGSTAVLMALHLLAPRIRRLPLVPEHRTASFAGGIAVSYVFLHLLPELAEGNTRLREAFGEETAPSPVVELGVFLVALTGFILFYGLERAAERSRARRDDSGAVFWVHLGSFALYNAVITYTLPSTYRTGVVFAVLFTVAMALHFVLSDRGLEEHYGRRFDRRLPRLLLAGALLLGWLLAVLAAPTRAVTVAVLTAFLAGSVLLNVFKEEVPDARRSSFAWFLAGAAIYAALLGAVTAAGA